MGSESDVAEFVPLNSLCVKVHSELCKELAKILEKVVFILPAIESARPGFKSGIQELCTLRNTIDKAKLLIQHCSECSKLYLALTGESIVLRCERIRASLNQSLSDLQNMVPEILASKISNVLDYIRDARFILETAEEEAGKAMLQLLGQKDSSEEIELNAFGTAVVRLNITSPKSILAERRSIKKLLDKIHGTDSKKEGILNFFLYLIMKYGKKVKADGFRSQVKIVSNEPKIDKDEDKNKLSDHGEAPVDTITSDAPPEEFCCPISSRLMYDPVVIASGKTYERITIEKWFGEGNDTCPKTQMKLENLLMIPNSCMKDMILNWCGTHGIKLEDPSAPFQSWEASSVASLRNVPSTILNGRSGNYILQRDNSSASFISSSASYSSDSPQVKDKNNDQIFPWSDDYLHYQSFSDFGYDMYMKFFSRLCELPSDLQYKAVEDVKVLWESDDEICYAMLSNGFLDALMVFLKNAYDESDVHIQRIGARIFVAFLDNYRVGTPSLSGDVYQLLTSLLDSEIILEAMSILQKLSIHPNSEIILSVTNVIKLLDFEDQEVVELAVRFLHNLSLNIELKSQIISSECIAKLATILTNKNLSETSLQILDNISDINEAAPFIANTSGCIASIAEILDCGTREEQGYGVSIFHSLCSYKMEYGLLILKEGVIPALVDISVNGNAKGKENAAKLLHVFKDMRLSGSFEKSDTPNVPVSETKVEDSIGQSANKQETPRSSGFFGRKLKFFSKQRTV